MFTLENFYNFWGKIKIPSDYKYNNSYILHISDTPSNIFSELKSLIKKTKPKIIIHTGDLVDDIKLEIYKNRISDYERHLEKLVNILESSSVEKIYYVIGNHDNIKSLKKFSKRGIIVKDYKEFLIEDFPSGLCHNFLDAKIKNAKYVFFGHNLSHTTGKFNKINYFNGIEQISLIEIASGKIFPLKYPHGTNNSRLTNYKIGI